jgi:hypothetical protein
MRIKVLNLDGTPDNVGDVFDKDTVITFPEKVPVAYSFFPEDGTMEETVRNHIAYATLERSEDGIYATFEPAKGKFIGGLTPAIGGIALERENNHMKNVRITCIGMMAMRNSDARIAPIDVEE